MCTRELGGYTYDLALAKRSRFDQSFTGRAIRNGTPQARVLRVSTQTGHFDLDLAAPLRHPPAPSPFPFGHAPNRAPLRRVDDADGRLRAADADGRLRAAVVLGFAPAAGYLLGSAP